MNTSSYSPIASGTYNHWKVEFVLKTKMTKTSIQRKLWRNFIQRGLMVPIFIHSRSLLFEGNALLKCVYFGLTPLSTVFQSYHDGVWLLQGAQCGLGGSHFYTYNSGFPCAFICLSFMLMAVDFSRTQKGYSEIDRKFKKIIYPSGRHHGWSRNAKRDRQVHATFLKQNDFYTPCARWHVFLLSINVYKNENTNQFRYF